MEERLTQRRQGMATATFALGSVFATPGALHALEAAKQTPDDFLRRHASGDWGELCPEDKLTNDQAVAHESNPEMRQRVLSAYATSLGTRIWVITEHDRSVTTLLLPEEY
jgi:invasion protein IalB